MEALIARSNSKAATRLAIFLDDSIFEPVTVLVTDWYVKIHLHELAEPLVFDVFSCKTTFVFLQ